MPAKLLKSRQGQSITVTWAGPKPQTRREETCRVGQGQIASPVNFPAT